MKRKGTPWRRLAGLIGMSVGVSAAAALARPMHLVALGPDEDRFIRVVDSPDGSAVRLELAIRAMKPAQGDGPPVYLVCAIHIGEAAYYNHLQKFLDDKPLVLFEGVKPPGSGTIRESLDGEASHERLLAATERRIRFVGTLVEWYRARHGFYPAGVQELAEGLGQNTRWLALSSLDDAWGHPLAYHAGPGETFDLVSFGADGRPGGEGENADVALSQQPPLTERERTPPAEDEGLQRQLAEALGLVFQLDAMHHDGANWRNSDVTVDRLQQLLDEAGADASMLLGALEGSSMQARLAQFVLRLIGSSPQMSAIARLVMLDMLAHADDILASAPGNMGAMMKVLIEDRNSVVIDDLRRAIAENPAPAEIGIIYGAGHMPDLEKRLTEELGYVDAGAEWVAAISVDLDALGMPRAQVQQLRRMLQAQMRAALEQARRQGGRGGE